MLTLLLLAVLHQQPPSPPLAADGHKIPSLALPGLTGVNLSRELLGFYSDHLAQQLTLRSLKVISASDISQLLGFERQRQLMDCSGEGGSCTAELANALGVDGLVTGSIGKLDQTYQLNLKVMSARDGRALSVWSSQARSEEQVLNQLTQAAERFARELTGAPPPLVTEHAAPPGVTAEGPATAAPLRQWSWVPAGAGVIAAGVGTFLLIQGNAARAQLLAGASASQPLENPAQLYANGKLDQQLGVALIAVGAAGVVAGAGMFALGGGHASVAFVPGPTPALVLAGAL